MDAVTIDSVTRSSISVSWTDLVGIQTGGTNTNPIAIDTYNLYASSSDSNDEYDLVATTSSTSQAVFIKSGVVTKFRISATNLIGESPLSVETEGVAGDEPTSPGKPEIVSREHSSNLLSALEVNIRWNAPFDSSGNLPISSYTVILENVSDGITSYFTINTLSFRYTTEEGLISGKDYTVKVRANNKITEMFSSKTGAESAITSFSTIGAPLRAPSLSVNSVTKTSATIEWTPLTTDEEKGYSSPVYNLMLRTESGEYQLIETAVDSVELTGVTPGSIYNFVLQAENPGELVSPYSDVLTVVFAELPGAPDAPVFIDRSGYTADGSSAYITISWKEPLNNGGLPLILGYKVEIKEGAGSWNIALESSDSSSSVTHRFEGLTAGSEYRFRVYARNTIGYSSESPETPSIY
jgi:uncharacterized protein YegP (UPF0339 family)